MQLLSLLCGKSDVVRTENEHNSTLSWAYDLVVNPVNTNTVSTSYIYFCIAFIYHYSLLSGPADPLRNFLPKRPLTTRDNIDFPRYKPDHLLTSC